MNGYKAFKKGLICEPTEENQKVYKENTVFEEENASVCNCGMHFCKNPLDVLNYYPLVNEDGELSEFAEVEALDEPMTDDDKKYCSKKLRIGAKISFSALVQASINFEYEKTNITNDNGGNYAQIGSSGNYAQIGSSGDSARIGSSGYSARIGSSGNYAQIGSSGYYAQIGSSGYSAQIGSSGNYAQIGSSGYSAQIGSSGNSAQIGSSGNYAVVMCAGNESVVKAKKGSWITLSEWKFDKNKNANIPICVKTVQVDGKKIKEDTFYKLINSEFVEVHNE